MKSDWAVVAIVVILACSGCSKPDVVCQASGMVSVDGRPAEGVYVVFTALGGPGKTSTGGSARTEKDGTYVARVNGPGEHAITAFWPAIAISGDETVEGEDRFKGKYQKVERQVLKTTIVEGDNVVPPIQLKHP